MDLNPTPDTNVTNSGPPGVRSATPSNGDRLAHRHGQFCLSPSIRLLESSYGQGEIPVHSWIPALNRKDYDRIVRAGGRVGRH